MWCSVLPVPMETLPPTCVRNVRPTVNPAGATVITASAAPKVEINFISTRGGVGQTAQSKWADYLNHCITVCLCPLSPLSNVFHFRGFYETAEGLCDACDSSCLTCDGDKSQCLSCAEGYYLESGMCRLNCSLRTYPADDGTCRRCPPHCDVCSDDRTCFSAFTSVKDVKTLKTLQPTGLQCLFKHNRPSVILECSFLYLMLNGVCKASCPVGYYEDMEEGRCGQCHPTCSSCSGPLADDCETCSTFSPKLYKGACSKECPSGTYYETEAMECQGEFSDAWIRSCYHKGRSCNLKRELIR